MTGPPAREVVALVGDGVAGWTKHLAGTLRGRDIDPVAIILPGTAPIDWDAEVRTLPDVSDIEALEGAGRSLERDGLRLRGMLSCQDGLIGPVAHAAERLGLPHPALCGVDQAHDKYRTRVATSEVLPSPRFALMGDRAESGHVTDMVGLPAIIKPIAGTASQLVRRIETVAELTHAYDYLRARLGGDEAQASGSGSADCLVDPLTTFLVEEFVDGPEYSADIVVRDGEVGHVSLLKKFLVTPETFHEVGFRWPPGEGTDALWEFVDRVVEAVGLDECLAHIELVDGPDGPRLIEVNAGRMGGLLVAPLAYLTSGFDLAEEMISCAIGSRRPDRGEPMQVGAGAAALTVFMDRVGEVVQVPPSEPLAGIPGVVSAFPMCAVGQHVQTLDEQVPAYGLLVTGTADEVLLQDHYRRAAVHVGQSLVMVSDGRQ